MLGSFLKKFNESIKSKPSDMSISNMMVNDSSAINETEKSFMFLED